MNILIVGEHGTGKSNMVDLLRNMIYKLDKDCTITTNDPDRSNKVMGTGSRQHHVDTFTEVPDEKDYPNIDVLIDLNDGKEFKKWFDEVS